MQSQQIHSQLSRALRRYVQGASSRKAAATRLGVAQSDVSLLSTGNTSRYSLRKLIDIATRAGFVVSVQIEEKEATR